MPYMRPIPHSKEQYLKDIKIGRPIKKNVLVEQAKDSREYRECRDPNDKKLVNKLLLWLLSDRKIQQHKTFWKYVSYVYATHGSDYGSVENFKDELFRLAGFCKKDITDAIIEGQNYRFIKYKVESIAYGNCSQKKFQVIFDKVIEIVKHKYGIDFELWLEEYKRNPELI
jgi:hypothetical protein